MNKKIISIFLFLIIIFTIAATYIYLKDTITNEKQKNSYSEPSTNLDIDDELDDYFLEEDKEVEIGEMI